LPRGLSSLGYSAFSGCASLTRVDLSKANITSIGGSAFSGCTALQDISLPQGLTSIDSSAFSGCSALTQIDLPASLTSIGSSAFYNCDALKELTVPASVTSIEYKAFSNCDALTSLTVEDGNQKYLSDGNCIIEKDTDILIAGCAASVIPSYIIAVERYAFYQSGIKNITLPIGVTHIGNYAFYSCHALTISFDGGNNITHIGSYAFYGCSSLTDEFSDEKNIAHIGSYAFANCYGILEFDILESITSLGYHAFDGWRSNQTVNVYGVDWYDANVKYGVDWKTGSGAVINYIYEE
jgi:hypothetical protein